MMWSVSDAISFNCEKSLIYEYTGKFGFCFGIEFNKETYHTTIIHPHLNTGCGEFIYVILRTYSNIHVRHFLPSVYKKKM